MNNPRRVEERHTFRRLLTATPTRSKIIIETVVTQEIKTNRS